MIWIGNLRKMRTESGSVVRYYWSGKDVLEEMPEFELNSFIGEKVKWKYHGVVHCVVTGEEMSSAFRMGMSRDAFFSSPLSCPSIINPELSTIHTGVALRDKEFEERYHNVPHVVYISRTDKLKVGVTGLGREHFRWNDQGAVEGIVVCSTPYRQLAGEIEVFLKSHYNDKTFWRNMLKDVERDPDELVEMKEECFELLSPAYEPFFFDDDYVSEIVYPIENMPVKVKSLKLEKEPEGEAVLAGIKGQYLIFEDGRVMNVRSHEGCRVTFEFGA